MERTLKLEDKDQGLKVEFKFADRDGKVYLETKALEMSVNGSRYVPYRVYGDKHKVSCVLPTTDVSAIEKHCSETFAFIKSEHVERAKSKNVLSNVVSGLLGSSGMAFTEVKFAAPEKTA